MYLTQLQTAADKFTYEENKALVFQALPAAAGSLGDPEQALQFSQNAVDSANSDVSNVYEVKISNSSVFLDNTELNAQAGNYRNACNLAHEENIATKNVLKILAVVLREYTQKHRL